MEMQLTMHVHWSRLYLSKCELSAEIQTDYFIALFKDINFIFKYAGIYV